MLASSSSLSSSSSSASSASVPSISSHLENQGSILQSCLSGEKKNIPLIRRTYFRALLDVLALLKVTNRDGVSSAQSSIEGGLLAGLSSPYYIFSQPVMRTFAEVAIGLFNHGSARGISGMMAQLLARATAKDGNAHAKM